MRKRLENELRQGLLPLEQNTGGRLTVPAAGSGTVLGLVRPSDLP
jgi:hypothetical protein